MLGRISSKQESIFKQLGNLSLENIDGHSIITLDTKLGQEKLFRVLDLIEKEQLTITNLTKSEPDFEDIFLDLIKDEKEPITN